MKINKASDKYGGEEEAAAAESEREEKKLIIHKLHDVEMHYYACL